MMQKYLKECHHPLWKTCKVLCLWALFHVTRYNILESQTDFLEANNGVILQTIFMDLISIFMVISVFIADILPNPQLLGSLSSI